MPYARRGNGTRKTRNPGGGRSSPVLDEGFGWDPPVPTVDVEAVEAEVTGCSYVATPPDPEILALGPPPVDASGIQKWNYQMLSIMAYKAAINPHLTDEQRMKRAAQLTAAAAKHYPEAAKYDLAQKIAADNDAMASSKRARAAGRLEACPPALQAKVIPIRRDV